MQRRCLPACAVGRDRDGWAVRSKAALLLVLATKKAGPAAVQALLPQLLLAAKESATHTEMVGHSALPPSVLVLDRCKRESDRHTKMVGLSALPPLAAVANQCLVHEC